MLIVSSTFFSWGEGGHSGEGRHTGHYREAYIKPDTQTKITQADRQTDRETGRQAGRQTDGL